MPRLVREFFRKRSRAFAAYEQEIMDASLIAKTIFFDSIYYREKYPDVASEKIDPALHYLRVGFKEGRQPSEIFNVSAYLDLNKDVKEAGINPVLHWIRYGFSEGRRPPYRVEQIKTDDRNELKALSEPGGMRETHII